MKQAFLYIASDPATFDTANSTREITLVTSIEEHTWSQETLVSTVASAPFVSLGDAIDVDSKLQQALLVLSPDHRLLRWQRYRSIMLAAPVSWGMYLYNEVQLTRHLTHDAKSKLNSNEFKSLETNPQTAHETKLRRERIERAVHMRQVYIGLEILLGLFAITVIFAGWRRLRAVPVVIGFAAAMVWLVAAGQAHYCFGLRAWQEWTLACFGLIGACSGIFLVPSHTSILQKLRERLRLSEPQKSRGFFSTLKKTIQGEPEKWRFDDSQRHDWAAMLAALAACLALPVFLQMVGQLHASDQHRVIFFILFCFFVFGGLLVWRPDLSKVTPKMRILILSAFLGFGITTAADVAGRAAFATVVEIERCVSANTSTHLKQIQRQSSRETTAARRDTQTQALAFWIAILAAPIAEEILYRGTLQRLARRVVGSRASILISGITFGLAHMVAFPRAFYQHIALGLAFAVVFEIAGGSVIAVVASALCHALWNLWLSKMPVF